MSGTNQPLLARHYVYWQDKVYGSRVKVPEKHYKTFKRAAERLRENRIPLWEYAYWTTKSLDWFLEQKGFRHVPVNTFCGTWAMNRYLKDVGPREYWEPDPKEEELGELLQDELLFAEFVREGQDPDTIVAEMTILFSDRWLEMFFNDDRSVLETRALDILSDREGKYLYSYTD